MDLLFLNILINDFSIEFARIEESRQLGVTEVESREQS